MNKESTKITEKEQSHLVIVGFAEVVASKYLKTLTDAIKSGFINSCSVIDLESKKDDIEKMLAEVDFIDSNDVYFLPDSTKKDVWADPEIFEPVLNKIIEQKGKIKVYISTELKAHEGYLKYCVENGIDSLTEKPIFAPMKDGQFDPSSIDEVMEDLVKKSRAIKANHSVMTLGRYHKVYSDRFLTSLKEKMIKYNAPITSLHFRHAGGVWNLHKEYDDREDHPYKYGYGMIMHGGYHYIDLVVQMLELNKLIYPDDNFSVTLTSYSAYPGDQNDRIPKTLSEKFDDNVPDWNGSKYNYGETDLVTSFCLKNKRTNKVLTLGTMALEQTTPSVRDWKDFVPGIYNKNGRVSGVIFEAQLSTIHSTNISVFDVPVTGGDVDTITAFARLHKITNAALLEDEEYNIEEIYKDVSHADSNRRLLCAWLKNSENKSRLEDHVLTMRLVKYLAMSAKKPGESITFDFL